MRTAKVEVPTFKKSKHTDKEKPAAVKEWLKISSNTAFSVLLYTICLEKYTICLDKII